MEMLTEGNKMIRVLVVDDDRAFREMLEDLLSEEEGLRVFSAENGEEACDKIRREGFDLIITDLIMPGVNGLDLLREAKSNNPNVVVIIITGFATLASALQAIKEGAYDYVAKPFSLEQMRVVVRNAAEKILLLRQNETLVENLRAVCKELAELKASRHKLNVEVQEIDRRMEESQEEIEKGLAHLGVLSSDQSPLHFRQRRRNDKGFVLLELEKLGQLRREGTLADEEFNICKEKLLAKL